MTTGSYCAHCGAKIELSSKFCSNCGRPPSLAAAKTAAGESSNKARQKAKKKAIVGIVVITLIVAIGAAYAAISSGSTQCTLTDEASSPSSRSALDDPQILIQEVGAYMSQQGWRHPQQENHLNMTRVAEGIVFSRYLEGSAVVVLVVQRPDCWSGSVMGSDFVFTTHDRCNTGYFSIPCGSFGGYSLAMQRSNEGTAFPLQSKFGKMTGCYNRLRQMLIMVSCRLQVPVVKK
jgi:hypothetical protein